MKPCISKIRFAGGIGGYFVANSFELSPPDVFQILAFRGNRSRFVQIDRNLIPPPYLFADMPGDGYAIFDADAFDRNKRHHISRAQAWMRSLMVVQIDQLGCFTHPTDRRFPDRLSFAHQRDHAAVMVGVHFAVEQVDAFYFHGFNNRVDFGLVPSLGEIRDTLH